VQTVGGTGAVRLGAAFLNRNSPAHSTRQRLPHPTTVYLGVPTWPNYIGLFAHAGFRIETYNHLLGSREAADIKAVLSLASAAPAGSIFIFQVCCHNPTGQDYTRAQWLQLAEAMLTKHHFVFFDLAYQGLASSMDNDAWPVRYFANQGIDLLVCQSFSKHMGLYSERVGLLHILCKSSTIAANVKDQLRSLIRWEVSSPPAYGARLATIIMQSLSLYQQWLDEVQDACDRMVAVRKALYELLVNEYQSPGSWEHILHERGLFSYISIDKPVIARLQTQHHIYMAESGRVNIAGLNEGNVRRFARAINLEINRATELRCLSSKEARL
jgi:aspartate aminotransferase, cytoplasmic